MKNILFYKFTHITDLEETKEMLLAQSKARDLRGKILIAEEGLNGCVSGPDHEIAEFTDILEGSFGPIEFKQGHADRHTFTKMFVRIRKEIITFKQDIDVSRGAPYIEPIELKQALDAGEDIVLLDARNLYESKIGRFKGAIAPNILTFTQLPKTLAKMPELKEKRIVTYCTGGIRCEKSSAWMLENGFANVQQLHGGIIRYGEECGNAHWEGKCFVFDRRGAIDIDPGNASAPITICEVCRTLTSDYHNCANAACDKYFLCCDACLQQLESCCSKGCHARILKDPSLKATTFLDEERPRQISE